WVLMACDDTLWIDPYWLVMGVSGSGKSTVAALLAQRLHGVHVDADDYHPCRHVERMRQGHPLSDDDRWPSLAASAEAARRAHASTGRPVFLACSALKRAYRDLLRERLPGLKVLFLDAPENLILQRLARRKGHFMGPGMLRSQLADLQS